MEKYTYTEVKNEKEGSGFSRTIFFRQALISSGVWSVHFLTGMGFGAPAVFIPQIRKEANSTEVISMEMESWLSSVFGYSGMVAVIFILWATHYIGRRIPFALVCVNTTVYMLIFYFSTSPLHLLISEILQGINHASNITLSVIIIAEYTSPRYRGIFLTFKAAILVCGIWTANAIGTFSHWRNIGLVGAILSLSNLTVAFWRESPYWLASKGRFDECETVHRWLKGTDVESEKELNHLIASQSEYLKSKSGTNIFFKDTIPLVISTVVTRQFYKPLLLSLAMLSMCHLTGKMVCIMYVIVIIKKITADDKAAYIGMLIMDGVTVLGMFTGCGLSKILKRRTLLLLSTVTGLSFMFILSIYLYLVRFSVLAENHFVSVTLLVLYSVFISCGCMILVRSIFGEIIPMKYKTSINLICTFCYLAYAAVLLKVSPYIFLSFGMDGAFLFYSVSASLFLCIIYKYLPETKDKTLQEIEEYFKDEPTENKRLMDEGK